MELSETSRGGFFGRFRAYGAKRTLPAGLNRTFRHLCCET
jgi:hypothetical protein